jgi:hypothetical protein
VNLVSVPHMPAVPGFAMVPGGLFPVSRLGALPVTTPPVSGTLIPAQNLVNLPNIPWRQVCPAWGCDGPPVIIANGHPVLQPPGTTTVPPPGTITSPAPVTPDRCHPWQARDAAGNCTDMWHHPYPVSNVPAPSPTVPAPTSGTPSAGQTGCVTGQFDAQGNCITSTVPGTTTESWFTDPTQDVIPGVPNWGLVAGGAAAVFLMMQMGKRR